MTDPIDPLSSLHRELGLKRLNPWWAKAEIVIGLSAAAIAMFSPTDVVTHWSVRFALFVLGFYFAMAGHRSHLYQSMNRLAAHLTTRPTHET